MLNPSIGQLRFQNLQQSKFAEKPKTCSGMGTFADNIAITVDSSMHEELSLNNNPTLPHMNNAPHSGFVALPSTATGTNVNSQAQLGFLNKMNKNFVVTSADAKMDPKRKISTYESN